MKILTTPLAFGVNEFYSLLAQGTLKAATHYGGADFACVLGQEMAGYATGEVYFASQALGLRHSHLDSGGYAYDQKHEDKDLGKAVDFLVADEASRAFLTSMVACLFARGVYTEELLAECLKVVGYGALADTIEAVSGNIQKLRWQTRLTTGFDPGSGVHPETLHRSHHLEGQSGWRFSQWVEKRLRPAHPGTWR